MLEVSDLNVAYGAVRAVRGVSLSVAEGEVVSLLGANGAGKSSLLNAIMRLAPKTGGRVTFDGRDITDMDPERIAAAGLTIVFEGRRVFPKLSVSENLLLGALAGRRRGANGRDQGRIYEMFPALADRQSQLAGTLSGGEQQMLAIGRALMSKPKMVLMDEPSLGLAPKIVDEVFERIERLKAEGMTMLIVEQNVAMGLSVADRGLVLSSGQVVQQGTAAELAASDSLTDAYVGGS
uniref:ABC transporter ATP-binding protein n=1 Tax=Chachezhania sediminis TaxID=2599291 RepID=UPI00131D25A3|nr:ABC transporter ATP-binding protein [Chachezhania sediminis]